jgi:hypothetical protein
LTNGDQRPSMCCRSPDVTDAHFVRALARHPARRRRATKAAARSPVIVETV